MTNKTFNEINNIYYNTSIDYINVNGQSNI